MPASLLRPLPCTTKMKSVFINCMKLGARLTRVTVIAFPRRDRWQKDLTRQQEACYKLAPCCLKAPSAEKHSVGACWDAGWTLGENLYSPPLVVVLLKILCTHCPFSFLSCLQNINAKRGAGRAAHWAQPGVRGLPPPSSLTWLLSCNLAQHSKGSCSPCFLLSTLEQALPCIAFSLLM